MRSVLKFIYAVFATLLLLAPAQQSVAWWGHPVHWGNWRHAYVHDPAYQHAPPAVKRYIRDSYRYGPAYAQLNSWRHWW